MTGSDISLQEELIKRQAEMHWAHLKDAYDKGFFHLRGQLKNQQNTSLQEEFNITPSLNFLVENSEETSDKNNTSLAKCKRLASIEVLASLRVLKQEVKHSLGKQTASLYHPSALCLLGIAGHLSRIT